MPEPRPGVLFDVDGTLLDTNYLHVLAWWQAFCDSGHGPAPMERIHRPLAAGTRADGLDAARTVVVGGAGGDVAAARKAHRPCIALTCGGNGAAELTEAGADAVYADPATLLDHLDGSPLGRLAAH